jgi:hypothetical protein
LSYNPFDHTHAHDSFYLIIFFEGAANTTA